MRGSIKHEWALALTAIISITIAGCFGNKQTYEAAEVVERSGDRDETPEWARGETPMSEENGKAIFISTITMSGDSRPEACARAAADSGRTEILRYIKDNLTASGQVSEASASSDPGVESLLAFLSQGSLSGVTVQQKYWERRLESDSAGERVLKVFCAAKVGISKTELTRQLKEAMGNGGNAQIRQKLLDAQQSFIESAGKK